jgi:cardiolipin synthase
LKQDDPEPTDNRSGYVVVFPGVVIMLASLMNQEARTVARRFGSRATTPGASNLLRPFRNHEDLLGRTAAARLLDRPTLSNRLDVLPGASESRTALLAAIRQARKSFFIETYIWHADEAGLEVAEALIARVREARTRGESFDARVLVDAIGLRSNYGTKDRTLIEHLNRNGVRAEIYNRRIIDLSARSLVPITHRKIFVADGEVAFTGGRNIGNEYLRPTFQGTYGNPATRQNSFRDLMVRIEGEEAARLQDRFLEGWTRTTGEALPPATPRKAARGQGPTVPMQTFVTDPSRGLEEIRKLHLDALKEAKREILVVSPYLADDTMIEALLALKREKPHLRIKVLIPFSGEGGKDLNYQAGLTSASQLLAGGIEVRLTQGGGNRHLKRNPMAAFTHMKTLVIDDRFMTVGSANMDARTYSANHEAIVGIADRNTVKHFLDHIGNPDWKQGLPIDQAWIDRNSSWGEKLFRVVFEWLDFLY